MIQRRQLIQALALGLPAASAVVASQARAMRSGAQARAEPVADPRPVGGGGIRPQREAAKKVVRTYIDACDQGDMAKIGAVVSADARWWILGRQDYDRDTIMAINQKRFGLQTKRASKVVGMAVEGDRVAIEYETAVTENGVTRFDIFHHVFLVRDNAIVSGREYLYPPQPTAKLFNTSQSSILARVPARPEDATPAIEEQTRKVVTAFTGPQMLSRDLRTPDFKWWLTGVGTYDLDKYLANLQALMKTRARAPMVRDDTRTIGIAIEGNRAAVEVARNVIFADHDYLDHFHLAFVLRDGKIAEMHEHTDVEAARRGGLPVLEAIAMG